MLVALPGKYRLPNNGDDEIVKHCNTEFGAIETVPHLRVVNPALKQLLVCPKLMTVYRHCSQQVKTCPQCGFNLTSRRDAQAKCAVDKTYVPNFGRAFDHFLLHTGGRGVIDALEEHLQLTAKQVQPSKDTLFRFGNTSAASTWYILAGIEHKSGVKKGDRVWQLGEWLCSPVARMTL